jgi:hypothetical protein
LGYNYADFLDANYIKLRASPVIWQIELSSLIFGKNVKNIHPTVWQKTWQFLAT